MWFERDDGCAAGGEDGDRDLRTGCLGVDDPDLACDSDDLFSRLLDFIPIFGLTQPSGVAGPNGVIAIESVGALLDVLCLVYLIGLLLEEVRFLRCFCGV